MIAVSVLQSTQHDEHHTDERGAEGGVFWSSHEQVGTLTAVGRLC